MKNLRLQDAAIIEIHVFKNIEPRNGLTYEIPCKFRSREIVVVDPAILENGAQEEETIADCFKLKILMGLVSFFSLSLTKIGHDLGHDA